MNKLICQKCGGEISNQFNATLSYCTNCGESLNFQADKILALPQNNKKPKGQFSVVLLTSLFTSVFLLTIVGGGFYMFFPRSLPENLTAQSDTKTTPTPRKRQTSSLTVADISEISLTYVGYQGIITGTEKSRSITNFEGFQANGTAFKFNGEIIYERGTKESEKMLKYRGSITKEQFKELAKVLIENDFLNEPDAKDRISVGNYTLKVKYSGGEKEIITSNTGKDTPEINAILEAFKNLQNQVEFVEVK